MSDLEVVYESYGNKLIGAGASGSGSDGHTIQNSTGTDMTQRSNLQFVGATVTDDSINDRTVVTINGSGEDIDASDVTYNETTVEAALDSLSTDVSGKVNKSGDTMSGSLQINKQSASTSTEVSNLYLGNNIPGGTTGNSYGALTLFGKGTYKGRFIDTGNILTADRDYQIPNKTGTLALTSDITDIGTSAKFVNLYVSGTSSSIKDVVQEVLNAITTDNKVCIVNAIYKYQGIRYLNGFIYADKLYGSFMLQTYYKDIFICGIENGTITSLKIT